MTADAPHPDVRLELRLLGEPAARVGAAELRTVNRKLICALAILALSRDRRASRDQVASRLWSESGQARARGSLRQMVTAMRKDFEEVGFDGYEATRSQLALRSGRVATDAEHLLDRAAAGEVHPALLDSVDLPAALMRGWDDVDPAFAEWLEAERDRLRERLRRAMRQILDHAGIDAPAGRDAAKALLRLDPTQERVAFALMTSLARGGDGAAALAVFGDLRRMLELAHDAAPGRELQALADRIRAGDFGSGDAAGGEAGASVGAGAGAGAETRPGRSARPDPVLEVEPFRLHGGGEAERAALDGLRDALIAAMVRFRELKVAEVDAPRPDDGAPAEGDGGGVRYALRASARPRPGGLSISMTLRERTSGEFLWSETEELDLDPSAPGADPASAAARRDAQLRNMAIALNVNLARERARKDEDSLRDVWLRSQRLILEFDPVSWRRARDELRALIARAPDYAPAWSALVQVENTSHIARPGVMRDPVRSREAVATALRAVELDPLDSRARLGLGWAQVYAGRWEAAEGAFDMAMSLNPHDAWILTSAAQAMAVFGRHELAARHAAAALQATQLGNRSRWGYHASIRLFAGDYGPALEAGILAGDSHANSGGWRAAALAHLGRRAEAREEAGRLVSRLARVWVAETTPDPAACARWLMGVLPTRRAEEWERFRDGLALAGLPTAGLDWPGADD